MGQELTSVRCSRESCFYNKAEKCSRKEIVLENGYCESYDDIAARESGKHN